MDNKRNRRVKSAELDQNYMGDGGHSKAKVYPKLGAWNRLEGRPRTKDFERVLSVEIHDALWMLTRQWQMGEFKGEDTGSAIEAKVKCRIDPITRYGPGSDPAQESLVPYNNEVPLEAMVECEPMVFDLKTHMQISIYWKRLLQQAGIHAIIFNTCLAKFPYKTPTFGNDQLQEKANFHTEPKVAPVSALMHNRIMNGEDFYNAVKDLTTMSSLLNDIDGRTINISLIDEQLMKFKMWFEDLYVQPTQHTAWNEAKLEYQFGQAVADGSERTALVAEEYYHGRLDWYAYDINNKSTDLLDLKGAAVEGETFNTFYKNWTLLPSEARFAGMPAARWWEFENGQVNFGDINAGTTDIAKILLAEFGLLYGHEWQIIPFKVPIGHVCDVEEIIVTDVFGQKTKVEAANKNNLDWSFFRLDNQIKDDSNNRDGRLLFPSTALNVQESKPIELVQFQRDEMANMIWAIESIIPGELGYGRNGREASQARRDYLGIKNNSLDQSGATFTYELINEEKIPDHWIPFVPVKLNPTISLREIQFLRSAIAKKLQSDKNTKTPLRPSGVILSEKPTPYLIHEEEIPRSGIQVSRSYQRTRWLNGKTFVWIGRRKTTGKGEANSGLAFDRIK